MKVESYIIHSLYKHDIFDCIIQQNHILCVKLWPIINGLDLFPNNNTKSLKNNSLSLLFQL